MTFPISVYKLSLVKDTELQLPRQTITTSRDLACLAYAINLHLLPGKEYHAVYLGSENQIVGLEMISKGTAHIAPLHPREVFKGACLANARSLALMHNHPSGTLEPDPAERDLFKRLQLASELVQIPLLDFIIVNPEHRYFSFIEE